MKKTAGRFSHVLYSLAIPVLFSMTTAGASAATVVLDSDNNWTYQVEPGLTIQLPGKVAAGNQYGNDYLEVFGGLLAIGKSTDPGLSFLYSCIGGDSYCTGTTISNAQQAISQDEQYALRSSSTSALYDIDFLSFQRARGSACISLNNECNTLSNGNTSFVISMSAAPLPAAVWLFSSGLLGLVGIARRKKA